MTIVRAPRPPDRFTRVANDVIEDPRLSFKALGLLVYILSKPDHWEVSREHLATTHPDGLSAVRSGLRELREAGYITTETVTEAPGRLAGRRMVVHAEPHTGEDPDRSKTDRLETDRSAAAGVVTTEVATTDEATEPISSATPSAPADATPSAEVIQLCTQLADAVERYRDGAQGARPKVTKAWHRDMRLLLERGPLGAKQAVAVSAARVADCIRVTFTELADPQGSSGFCWASNVQSPSALRRHWWKLYEAAVAGRRRSQSGKLAAVSRAVTGDEPEPLSAVLANHAAAMAERRGLPPGEQLPALGATG